MEVEKTLWRSAAVRKFTNVEMCRITEELIFQEPYQVGDVPRLLTVYFLCCLR